MQPSSAGDTKESVSHIQQQQQHRTTPPLSPISPLLASLVKTFANLGDLQTASCQTLQDRLAVVAGALVELAKENQRLSDENAELRTVQKRITVETDKATARLAGLREDIAQAQSDVLRHFHLDERARPRLYFAHMLELGWQAALEWRRKQKRRGDEANEETEDIGKPLPSSEHKIGFSEPRHTVEHAIQKRLDANIEALRTAVQAPATSPLLREQGLRDLQILQDMRQKELLTLVNKVVERYDLQYRI